MKIGSLEFEDNVFLAPMAGVTDLTFRLICKEMGVGLLYTEMISSKGLYFNDKKTHELMKIEEKEKPVALQIFGSDPEVMANITNDKLNKIDDFAIVDINMGCPAPKIVKNGDGSALMKTPKLIGRIVKEVVKYSNKPVTVKIRKGWDDNNQNAVEVAKIIEDAGASAITVHGRTREQFYSGKADWDMIRRVKENISIPVIGNGDVFVPEDGKKLIEETGCDAIMIGRGARGNPWIFKRTLHLLKTGELLPEPSDEEKIDVCIKHLNLLCTIKNEKIAVKEMRKHIAWYIKGMKNSAEMRNKINTISDKDELEEILYRYKQNS
ncbi:putative tRNA-dihydrouridine synthase 1 [Gottschalkia purinilytica]|uniref:tRNA-dihydrouridine synthase n=1 Tax=Gottschalkia purinilytica TaxID=1503 RepID=A0A0L0W8Q2_GOTPU|nr:tRNA dihydrouridine synthase DusB [Gottschalkia purinilytica]KNF07827.1 putative tRNA-dihydrouridine synthase 1 [Gottschalkia purinilytica]